MSMTINHNLQASNAARNLNTHYANLAKSTRRLSSGLRVSSSSDDAAGLAIRELMRADISVMQQGARNVNDAISMIQVADGALAIIDEKLIRMKELAEQAATGTYNSDQRMMIDSEFQAMAAEIDRIAKATDFNGIKLIDGDFETPAVEITGPDGKTYDVALNSSFIDAWQTANAGVNNAWDVSGIKNPGAIVGNRTITITNDNIPKLGDNFLLVDTPGQINNIPAGTTLTITCVDPTNAFGAVFSVQLGNNAPVNVMAQGNTELNWTGSNGLSFHTTLTDKNGAAQSFASVPVGSTTTWTAQTPPSFTASEGNLTTTLNGNTLEMTLDLGNDNVITQSWNLQNGEDRAVSSVTINLNVRDTTPGQGDDGKADEIPDNVVKIHFGTGNDSAEDYYYIEKRDSTIEGLGLSGTSIETQSNAQNALGQLDDAIIKKDNIRAYYGGLQNRFENTLSNIRIQSENLQAAESQISDADISLEMTQFVRNQILVQSGVAMLAQANSLPRMALQLISG